MNKIVLIFDYFKEAFHTNKQNKSLYKPQLALIAFNVLLILFVGFSIYSWIGMDNIMELGNMDTEEVFAFFFSQGLKVLAMVLVYAIISVLLEAGLLNMYKKAVTTGFVEPGSFGEGISKYFLKLLFGKLLIMICYIVSLPFYLILGLITLTVGLTVIPMVAGVFLTMWKVSLVMNDNGIFQAIGDSFRFAKRNFIPLTVLQVIHWAFQKGATGGSGGGGGSNFNVPSRTSEMGSDIANEFSTIPGFYDGVDTLIRIIKIAVAIVVPVIAIASAAAAVFTMIFEVFFMLALFIAYKNDFVVVEKTQESEALEAPEVQAITESAEEISSEEIDQEERSGEVEQ